MATIRYDLRTAYAVALAMSVVASVLTIVYVGGDAVGESNPVTAALIGRFGLLSAMTIRTLAVVVLYWGYYVVAVATGVPRAALAFAWLGAGINYLDAFGNLAVAIAVGPTVVTVEQGVALCLTVALAALAARAGPPRDPSSTRERAGNEQAQTS